MERLQTCIRPNGLTRVLKIQLTLCKWRLYAAIWWFILATYWSLLLLMIHLRVEPIQRVKVLLLMVLHLRVLRIACNTRVQNLFWSDEIWVTVWLHWYGRVLTLSERYRRLYFLHYYVIISNNEWFLSGYFNAISLDMLNTAAAEYGRTGTIFI